MIEEFSNLTLENKNYKICQGKQISSKSRLFMEKSSLTINDKQSNEY